MRKTLLLLILTLFSFSAIHADVADDFDWKLEGSTLTISGTGDMPDYEIHDNKAPWRIYQDKIEKVVIKTNNGKGSASIEKLPEGWYEIREAGAGSSWATHWINEATVSNGNKVIRLDSDNRTNAAENSN